MMLFRLMLSCLLLTASALASAETSSLAVTSGDVDIPVTRYEAPGKQLILWLPSEYGVLPAEHIAARHLAEKGLETWLPDFYGARFLPSLPSSAENLSAEDIYRVIRAAARQHPKRKLWLLTAGRGAKYTLEGARLWAQREGRKHPLAGAVLLYPNLYEKQPEPGEDPSYLPIARQTRLRLIILQGELSPWYWTLDTLQAALAQRGSQVRTTIFTDIRDRFYFREDAKPVERAVAERLPEVIAAAIQQNQSTNRSKQ